MKDQEIQTEIVGTVDRDEQAGDTQQQQGVHLLISATSSPHEMVMFDFLTLNCNDVKMALPTSSQLAWR